MKHFLLFLLIASFSACQHKQSKKTENEEMETDSNSLVRRAVLSYWTKPDYVSKDFGKQLTGTDVELEFYHIDQDSLYFSYPRTKFDSLAVLSQLTDSMATVQFAKQENGKQHLGKYIYNDNQSVFFRLPTSHFSLIRPILLSFPFKKWEYSLKETELLDYLHNKSIYGGKLNFVISKKGNTFQTGSNHGAFVAVKNEPSLTRFAQKITENKSTETQKIQALLDLVTKEVSYNFKELRSNVEVLKRPNEVLMSKSSDCSGKTILFASLLEQIGADYRLTYMEHHICVWVAGDFPKKNKAFCKIDGKTFFLAETTAKGYVIGESLLTNKITEEDILFVQKPAKDAPIVHYKTGNIVDFR